MKRIGAYGRKIYMSQTWKWFIPLLFPVDWLALRHMTITNCKVETSPERRGNKFDEQPVSQL